MVKKILIVSGVVLVLGGLLFGTSMVSYMRTSATAVREAVEDSVPMEFQIERARQMIKDLVPEIRKNMHVIAKEEVEVARLEEQIEGAEIALAKDKTEIMRLKGDLGSGDQIFHYAGKTYTENQVRTDLANRFERFKTADATLGSLKQIYEARQRSLDAAREKLESMLAAKRQLEVEVENLEARLQMVEAARASSEFTFDDSQLGRAKELVTSLKKRLEVAEKLVNAEGDIVDEIPLDATAPENIEDDIAEYFGEGRPETETLAQER